MSYGSCFYLPDYICSDCPETLSGRITAVAYTLRAVTKQATWDPTVVQNWYDLTCNKFGVIIPNVRGSYDGSTAVEGPGFGSQSLRLLGRNHQITYMHDMECENIAFYNELQKSSQYEFWWLVGETKLFRSTNAAFPFAAAPVTEELASIVEFNVTVKFTHPNLPICYDVPPQIFDSCAAQEFLKTCLTCRTVDVFTC